MERDMSYSVSFQVSCSICNLYLTKLTLYQNCKRNFDVIKSIGNVVMQDSFSFSTSHHCKSMTMGPGGPRITATEAKENDKRLCKHNNTEEICQQEVYLDKAISSLRFQHFSWIGERVFCMGM